jgi:hypothetical protein
MKKIILLVVMIVSHTSFAAEPLCTYTARLSDQDKVNSSGASLIQGANKSTVAAIIRQDRANYHSFNKRDPEDTDDCMFSDKNKRSQIDSMATASHITQETIDSIINKSAIFKVTIYPNSFSVVSIANNSQPGANVQSSQNKAKSPNAINERAANLLFCYGLLMRASGIANEDANQRMTGEAKATTTQLAEHLSRNGEDKISRAIAVVFGNQGGTENTILTWLKSNQVISIINKGGMEANRIIVSTNGYPASFSMLVKGTNAYTKSMECLKLE